MSLMPCMLCYKQLVGHGSGVSLPTTEPSFEGIGGDTAHTTSDWQGD